MNEYCSMTVNGEDLDDYLERNRILIRLCTTCNPNYEKGLPYTYQYCEKHQPTPEQEQAEQLRIQRELERACLYLERRDRKEPRTRSDGKDDIEYKYRKCMTKAERRARKIDRRK